MPILGEHYGVALERGEIALRFDAQAGELSLWYFEHRLPIRPAEYPRVLLGVDLAPLEAQSGKDVADELRGIADAFAAVPMVAAPIEAHDTQGGERGNDAAPRQEPGTAARLAAAPRRGSPNSARAFRQWPRNSSATSPRSTEPRAIRAASTACMR